MNKNIELLAPVGSMDSLKAAVLNGADAVYLGGKMFSARKYASNFDYEELKEAVEYSHLRGVKVYVTANTLLDNSEMKEALDYIKYLYEIDVDGVIVQDYGLAMSIRKLFPDMEVHGSTQMTINNLEGAKLLEEMGFTRVVLAREVPIEEIKYIKENSNIELEVFIHGALCVSYSGQCLMSSMIGGRSGNRGSCAQPCRMPSSLVDNGGTIVKDFDKKHLLSPRDLNTLEEIHEIINSGVVSLKIEGRMKRPEYVATVVKNYRKAIDLGSDSLEEKDFEDVKQIFNREFTKGLMFGEFGRDFVSGHRPDNRGVEIGTVLRADKYKIYVKLEKDVLEGDGIEFILENGDSKGLRVPFDSKAGTILHLDKPGYILNGTPVHKTSSVELLERAKDSFENKDESLKVDMEVEILIGNKPKIILIYKNQVVEETVDFVVEEAKRAGLSKEKVIEQMSKLGDTPYELNNININLEEQSFMPLSVLNELRRNAIESLDKIRVNYNNRESVDQDDYEEIRDEILYGRRKDRGSKKLSVKVNHIRQFDQLNLDKLDRIYFGFTEKLGNAIERLTGKDIEIYLYTEKILYNKNLKVLKSILDVYKDDLDGVVANNLGTIKFIKENYDLKIHGDIGLNGFNSFTLNELEDLGLDSITLSPELTLHQIRRVEEKVSIKTEALAYGYIPVMTTKHCPMSLVKGCKSDNECGTCAYNKGYSIKDRIGAEFPMERKSGFTTIYNSVPLMVLDKLFEISNSGIEYSRLDFSIERDNIRDIQEAYYDYLNDVIDIYDVEKFISEVKERTEITNGHYYRGVMN